MTEILRMLSVAIQQARIAHTEGRHAEAASIIALAMAEVERAKLRASLPPTKLGD